MKWTLVLRLDETAYRQICDYVRTQVALGNLKPEERLPAIRELARSLKLDPGTVARAYRELEREGTITTQRGGGSFISGRIKKQELAERRKDRLDLVIGKAIVESLGSGFSIEDIETVFTTQLARWRERHTQPKGKKRRREPGSIIRFQGSHDLAVELLARHLNTLHPESQFTTEYTGSLAGMTALARGEADIAGAHLFDEESGEYNIPFVKKLMPNESVVVINLVQRIQGLMVPAGNPKHVISLRDTVRRDITFINRQKGSGTRILLDTQLRRLGVNPSDIKGYEIEEQTHVAVASRVAEGTADVGLGAQSAASVAGLDFIPLAKERYDLIWLKGKLDGGLLSVLPDIIRSESYLTMLNSIPGYDTSATGQINVVSPEK